MDGMCRIELGPKAGDIRVVPCDPSWVEEVRQVTGKQRMHAIEPTLRGYIAQRLQSVGMLRTLFVATPDECEGLRRTLEALSQIDWDPGTRVEIRNTLKEGWEGRVTGHQADFLRRAVNRCLLGPVRPTFDGEASQSGPSGTREAALAGH